MYRTLVADPPWSFDDSLPGSGRGALKHYELMTLEEICSYPLPPLADDCRLFLWRTSALQAEALHVIEAWGFKLKTEMVWLKTTKTGKRHFGMGRTVRMSHETCLIAVRGNPDVLSRRIRSTFTGRVRNHSEKPERFFQLVECLSPGPYCELFARRERKGWYTYGLEVGRSSP